MPVGEHGQLTTNEGIHIAYQWSYADAAARTGATGFVAADVGKMARQLDNNTLWMLTATTPTWVQVSGNAIAHDTLTGLGDDDHPQYFLVDGTRPMTGDIDAGSNSVINASIDAALIDSGTLPDARIQASGVTQHQGSIDHGSISGLTDIADHPGYLDLAGTRPMTGSLDVGDNNITNVGNIALDSISSDAGTSIAVTLGTDAGDDFNVGSGKLVVEGDTGRVGIGQSAPESTMHINSANTIMAVIVDGHGDPGLSDNFFGASSVPVGIKCNSSDLGIMLEEYSGGEDWSIGVNATGDLIFSDSETSPKIIFQDGTYNVGIGTTTTLAQLHVDQSSATGAKPVLYLDQADLSKEIIEIFSTEGVGNAVEAVGVKTLTTTHFIKITLNSVTRYIPCGTIA